MADIDIKENDILARSPELLDKLLEDHTTKENIFWATHNYEGMGEGYRYFDKITRDHITGEHGNIIMPRVLKNKDVQTERVKDMAEVFTPSWVCNAQINLIDDAWFGHPNAFNVEDPQNHTWKETEGRVEFPDTKGKTWKDYVGDNRLEITCGEGPYLCNRYDATTGEYFKNLNHRCGIIDRKLRVVRENTETSAQFLRYAQKAYECSYGYEWQGDNLLLAREAMLYTFIDNYKEKFGKEPALKSSMFIAYIIGWNIFQMDGLKLVIPNSCRSRIVPSPVLFSESEKVQTVIDECPGCKEGNIHKHNGIYCKVRDWRKWHSAKSRAKADQTFESLL